MNLIVGPRTVGKILNLSGSGSHAPKGLGQKVRREHTQYLVLQKHTIKTCDTGQLLLVITVTIHNKNLYAHIVVYFKILNTFWNLLYKNSIVFPKTKTNHADMTVFAQ